MSKMDGLSLDLEAANKEKLRAVFPECFTEGTLNIDKLLSLCGEYIDNVSPKGCKPEKTGATTPRKGA